MRAFDRMYRSSVCRIDRETEKGKERERARETETERERHKNLTPKT